jgi:hypothetical protein
MAKNDVQIALFSIKKRTISNSKPPKTKNPTIFNAKIIGKNNHKLEKTNHSRINIYFFLFGTKKKKKKKKRKKKSGRVFDRSNFFFPAQRRIFPEFPRNKNQKIHRFFSSEFIFGIIQRTPIIIFAAIFPSFFGVFLPMHVANSQLIRSTDFFPQIRGQKLNFSEFSVFAPV